MSLPCYVELLHAGPSEPARLGGKGANLCRLMRHGHRVPPGFVITREAFRATLDALDLSPAPDGLSSPHPDEWIRGGELIRQRLLSGRVPPKVLEPVLRTIEGLRLWENNRDGLILRSSATVEDSASHSFAGIFESIPLPAPAALEAVLREVWASAFSPRALAYYKEIGLRQMPEMAVIVQRFLPAERSGVMFTRFPLADGRMRILIEHVAGACEKLVRGEVTPERLWLDGPDDPAAGQDGKLGPAHVRELARLAARLEEEFGSPQDVEWVVCDGQVHVVQSRPITGALGSPLTLPSPPLGGEGKGEGGAAAPPDSPVILTGIPASPGVGAGRVHLAFNIEQALRLPRGSVLATPMTNPDMVIAMRAAAAVVTDVGGMICHAAIVSRELGLPCVVGTETATTVLAGGEAVTVDGSRGRVCAGIGEAEDSAAPTRAAEWADLWSIWLQATGGRPDWTPIVATRDALEAMPEGIRAAALVPDLDLRMDDRGLWNDLEGMDPGARQAVLTRYLARLASLVRERGLDRLYLLEAGGRLPRRELAEAVRRVGEPRLVLHAEDAEAPAVVLDPGAAWPPAPAAVPLGSAAAIQAGAPGPAVGGMAEAQAAALDTLTFFGHRPASRTGAMPDPALRGRWWAVLPEYGRFHQQFATAAERGQFDWLEVRPELVISALLKSLVQPGFEMVPRVLGFAELPPLHVKWIRCRYHFRADTFARVWPAIVRATWDETYLADLLRRVRASYEHLREVLVLFPTTDEELAAASGEKMAALVTSWWPRWVEFFALCWFLQAQGDDILAPFLQETVGDNLARLGAPPARLCWPAVADFLAPTTPVLSAEYMADVAGLRESLLAAGLDTLEAAEAALARGRNPDLAGRLTEHLRKWHWMRDRDLLFEPWDTPGRVLDTALRTPPHRPAPYEANRRRQRLALAFHFDLAHAGGRAAGLHHAARFLHDLNVERENHHVLWLRFSYPLRRLIVELERRLIAAGSLERGDVFFLQAPEWIEAARNLPAPLPPELAARVKNRRRGYLQEARLPPVDAVAPVPEDDYY